MRKLILAATMLAAALYLASPAAAQTAATDSSQARVHPSTPGVVAGRVLSADGEPLAYTNIVFQAAGTSETVGGTLAITEGRFVHRIEPGRYDILFIYIGYERVAVEGVEVAPGGRAELGEIRMKVKPILMERFAITEAAIRNTERAALARQQKAVAVSDAVTAEQMSRASDSDAAEALQRVTGVSVVGGKYVFVRGLGDRYSSTRVNGASLSSPEPNRRTIPLDIFPTGLIEAITIHKTYTPDMPGEFGGGVVDVVTRSVVDRRSFSQKFKLGWSENVSEQGFLGYRGGNWDFLGIDDGTRALPGLVSDVDGRVYWDRTGGDGPSLDEILAMRRSFQNTWTPTPQGTPLNFGYSGHYADRFQLLGKDASVLASLTLSNSFSSSNRIERNYQGSTEIIAETDYQVQQSTHSTLGGLTSSVGWKVGDDDNLKYNLLYTQTSDDKARFSQGPNDDYGTSNLTQYQLTYVERTLQSHVVDGTHGLPFNSTLEWTASNSNARRDEPDRRLALYEASPLYNNDDELIGEELLLSGRAAYPLTRIFGASDEDDNGLNVSWKLPLLGNQELRLGGSYRLRDRFVEYRRFGIRCPFFGSACGDRSLLPEQILDPSTNSGEDRYILEELTRSNDSYGATHRVRAVFSALDLRMARALRVSGGVRVEESEMAVDANSPFAAEGEVERARRDNLDALPTVNVTWALSERQNLRLGYSKTVNRPELRELSPFSMFNYELGLNETGTPTLRQARIHSYDARWEMYPGDTQYAAFSFFYKDLRQPIEKVTWTDTGSRKLEPRNGDVGLLRGVELELRTTLGDVFQFLGRPIEGTPHRFFYRWGIAFNHARIHSEVVINDAQTTIMNPLNGQSDRTTNLGLFYGGEKLEGAILYKDFGRRLHSVGLGRLPDIYEYPPRSLDLSLGLDLGSGFGVKLGAENLLDENIELLQGDLPVMSYRTGTKLGFGIEYSY